MNRYKTINWILLLLSIFTVSVWSISCDISYSNYMHLIIVDKDLAVLHDTYGKLLKEYKKQISTIPIEHIARIQLNMSKSPCSLGYIKS